MTASADQSSEEYIGLLKLKEITTKNLLFTDDFIRKTDNRYVSYSVFRTTYFNFL